LLQNAGSADKAEMLRTAMATPGSLSLSAFVWHSHNCGSP